MKKMRDLLIGFLTVHILWFCGSVWLDSRALPNPITVYREFGAIWSSGVIRHVGMSLFRIMVAVGISLALGIPIGYLMARRPFWGRSLHPVIYACYSIPKTALLPVAMLLYGLGNRSKILIMVLTMVFQIIIATKDAVLFVPESLYQVGKSIGRSEGFLIRHVTIPAILPEIVTAVRINLGTALAILLIVEAYGTRMGIGYFILDSWSRMNYNEMYGGIVVISLLGAVLFLMIDLGIERICKWKKQI